MEGGPAEVVHVVHVDARPHQPSRDRRVPALGGADQRVPLKESLLVEVGSVRHGEVEEVDVPLAGRDQERALLRVVLGVDVGAPLDQPPRLRDVVVPGSRDQPGVQVGLLAGVGHGGLRGGGGRGGVGVGALVVGCASGSLGERTSGRDEAHRQHGHDPHQSHRHTHEGRDAGTASRWLPSRWSRYEGRQTTRRSRSTFPLWTRGSQALRVSVVDAWLGPMSTTVREEYEVGDLDPAGVLEAAAEAEQAERRAAFRKLELAAHWADLHPATADTGVETFGGRGPAGRRVTRRGRHPGRGGVHPRTVRAGVGHVPLGRGPADRRRPRPPPPAPAAVETRVAGWRCRPGRPAASPARPTASPRPPRSGSTNSSPTAAPAAPSIVDRLVAQAIATYDPETHEDREDDAEAGWDVTLTHPDPTDFLGTSHLEATGDTLVLKEFYDHVCGIAHQLYLDGDTSPLGVRKIKALGILTGQPTTTGKPRRSRSTSASRPATSNPTPSPPARSRSSAPPPSPRSATGSATTKS